MNDVRAIANTLTDDDGWVEAFLRYVNWRDYLWETRLDQARMVDEGCPPPTPEQQRWLVLTYAPKK